MPKGTKPRQRQLARTNHHRAQNAVGVSHQDNVRAVRKFMVFSSLPINNANSEYAFGVKAFNVSGLGTPLSALLDDYGRLYEQYRIRRVRVRVTPGKGYTNDLRLKTYVTGRVDVDKQDDSSTISALKAILNAENSVTKTMVERGNILIADFKPQCRVNTTASLPILPNRLQFYPIGDYGTHVWRGCVLGAFLPEPSLPSSISLTMSCEVDVEFRGRVTSPTLFTTDHLNQEAPAPTPDILEDLTTFRTNMLTGVWFPISGFGSVNVGNIGHTVTAEQILGAKIRIQSTMKIYEVYSYSQADDYVGLLEEVTI